MDVLAGIAEYKISLFLILATTAAGVKIIMSRIDSNLFSFSYRDCFEKGQWWRLLSSNIYHASVTHLALDVLTLWDVRTVEGVYGSVYFFKYTILLIVCQKGLQIFVLHIIASYWSQFLPLVRSINTVGCTGLVFAWMGFLAIVATSENSTTYIFGLFPVSVVYAPTIMILIYQILMPRSAHTLGCLSGLVCGVLLGLGILQVLPTWYWTGCFLFDVMLLSLQSMYSLCDGSRNERSVDASRRAQGGLPEITSEGLDTSRMEPHTQYLSGVLDV